MDDVSLIPQISTFPQDALAAELAAPADPPSESEVAEAQVADAELDRLLAIVKEPLSRLAILVHRIRDRLLFKALGFDSFEAYIASKQLQFSRSFVFQLAKVGKMLEASGIDPASFPQRDFEITKLAQIARLPDPAEQRRVVETGYFDLGEEERPLREIPVRELTTHVDRRLGREPKGPRTLSETYDDSSIPWDGPRSFDDEPQKAIPQSASFQEMRIAGPATEWRGLLDSLASVIRPLEGPDRDDAINALSRLYQELVGF